ncbi:MAG TPA: FAD-dependent oxidoreductase [Pyrinomonadaceae bacterium]|nr:FAD-dependent oxidoreductase [Pyrinomonadaceae bacterium]
MSRVLILGGGFGGIVAAEALAQRLGDEHQITMVSRSSRFVFYPALVRLAFGECEPDDVSFDLRKTMLNRRVTFIKAEVARIDPDERKAVIAHGEVEGTIPYDYLIYALGRRLATERVTGFFEHAHHLLNVEGALRFGEAIRDLNEGRVVIGECPHARLPVSVYETAFALSKWLRENGDPKAVRITVVSPTTIQSEFGDEKMAVLVNQELLKQGIELVPNFPIASIGSSVISTNDGRDLNYQLLMLLPPFGGSSAISHLGVTNDEAYVNVDWTMKVIGAERIYAVGDCVNLAGPKMGHMAVNQAQIAAANLAAEIAGHEPVAHYQHDIMMVLDVDGDGIYFHKDLWSGDPASVRHGRFWSWAKRIHEKYWEATHA